MLMKKIIFCILIYLLFYNSTFATNTQGFLASWLTIKELSQNIEKLKEEKIELDQKTKILSKEYWELISFMRNDLNSNELNEIKSNIESFIEKRNILQNDLKLKIEKLLDVEKEKRDLILLRADIYKYLAKYVAREKREAFIEHIKFQTQSEKESKDLIESILKSQNILDQKVTYIKEKIETHREDLNAKIEISITQKIKQRIDEIDKDPKYKEIDQKIKNKIYNDFINQLENRLKDLEKSILSENYKEMRKNILNKMIDEIKSKIK